MELGTYTTYRQKRRVDKNYVLNISIIMPWNQCRHVGVIHSFELSFYGLMNPNEHGVIDGQKHLPFMEVCFVETLTIQYSMLIWIHGSTKKQFKATEHTYMVMQLHNHHCT